MYRKLYGKVLLMCHCMTIQQKNSYWGILLLQEVGLHYSFIHPSIHLSVHRNTYSQIHAFNQYNQQFMQKPISDHCQPSHSPSALNTYSSADHSPINRSIFPFAEVHNYTHPRPPACRFCLLVDHRHRSQGARLYHTQYCGRHCGICSCGERCQRYRLVWTRENW